MLRMSHWDLSLMKPRFYPLLMCKAFYYAFVRCCIFIFFPHHAWMDITVQTNFIALLVRRACLFRIVLPKFGFDSFHNVSQRWLTCFVVSICVQGRVLKDVEAVSSARWTCAKRNVHEAWASCWEIPAIIQQVAECCQFFCIARDDRELRTGETL